MNVKQCPAGHFYDGDKYNECPACGKVSYPDNYSIFARMALLNNPEDGAVPDEVSAPVYAGPEYFNSPKRSASAPFEPTEANRRAVLFCPQCGRPLWDDSERCPSCGRRLDA